MYQRLSSFFRRHRTESRVQATPRPTPTRWNRLIKSFRSRLSFRTLRPNKQHKPASRDPHLFNQSRIPSPQAPALIEPTLPSALSLPPAGFEEPFSTDMHQTTALADSIVSHLFNEEQTPQPMDTEFLILLDEQESSSLPSLPVPAVYAPPSSPVRVYAPPSPVPIYAPPSPVPVYALPSSPVPVYAPPSPVPIYAPPSPVPVYALPSSPVPVYAPPSPVPIYAPPSPVPVYALPSSPATIDLESSLFGGNLAPSYPSPVNIDLLSFNEHTPPPPSPAPMGIEPLNFVQLGSQYRRSLRSEHERPQPMIPHPISPVAPAPPTDPPIIISAQCSRTAEPGVIEIKMYENASEAIIQTCVEFIQGLRTSSSWFTMEATYNDVNFAWTEINLSKFVEKIGRALKSDRFTGVDIRLPTEGSVQQAITMYCYYSWAVSNVAWRGHHNQLRLFIPLEFVRSHIRSLSVSCKLGVMDFAQILQAGQESLEKVEIRTLDSEYRVAYDYPFPPLNLKNPRTKDEKVGIIRLTSLKITATCSLRWLFQKFVFHAVQELVVVNSFHGAKEEVASYLFHTSPLQRATVQCSITRDMADHIEQLIEGRKFPPYFKLIREVPGDSLLAI
ncbi:hypothetical protein H0H92_003006 [Tricholoma furcatifolium]|nr:hypothetical protein H0H92_003006 [Tricholoma furcatifolium]